MESDSFAVMPVPISLERALMIVLSVPNSFNRWKIFHLLLL